MQDEDVSRDGRIGDGCSKRCLRSKKCIGCSYSVWLAYTRRRPWMCAGDEGRDVCGRFVQGYRSKGMPTRKGIRCVIGVEVEEGIVTSQD